MSINVGYKRLLERYRTSSIEGWCDDLHAELRDDMTSYQVIDPNVISLIRLVPASNTVLGNIGQAAIYSLDRIVGNNSIPARISALNVLGQVFGQADEKLNLGYLWTHARTPPMMRLIGALSTKNVSNARQCPIRATSAKLAQASDLCVMADGNTTHFYRLSDIIKSE
jgi:hypothetical protein